jgi:hypothetical protein
MLCLIHVSSATRALMTRDGLADLLRASRARNAAAGITGVLLYAGGNVMQALEGGRDAVEALYARIERDPRHLDPTRLLGLEVAERQFPGWSMALHDLGDLPPAERARCERLMAEWSGGADPAGLREEAAVLLGAFCEVTRVARAGGRDGPGPGQFLP